MEPNRSRNTNSNGFSNSLRNENAQTESINNKALIRHNDLVNRFASAEDINIDVASMKSQLMIECSNYDGERVWIMSYGHSHFKTFILMPPDSTVILPESPVITPLEPPENPADSDEENPLPLEPPENPADSDEENPLPLEPPENPADSDEENPLPLEPPENPADSDEEYPSPLKSPENPADSDEENPLPLEPPENPADSDEENPLPLEPPENPADSDEENPSPLKSPENPADSDEENPLHHHEETNTVDKTNYFKVKRPTKKELLEINSPLPKKSERKKHMENFEEPHDAKRVTTGEFSKSRKKTLNN